MPTLYRTALRGLVPCATARDDSRGFPLSKDASRMGAFSVNLFRVAIQLKPINLVAYTGVVCYTGRGERHNMKRQRKSNSHHIGHLPMREVDTRPVQARRSFRQSATLRIRNSRARSWWSLVVLLALVAILFLVAALLVSRAATGARNREIPLDLNSVGSDVVLAEVAGVDIASPIHPEDLTALGYHPGGKNLLAMSPRGRALSGNFLLGLFEDATKHEKIWYHLMDRAGRSGPDTGAMDVGAEAGTAVYAPVTGTVVAIRPDPLLPDSADTVVIKPADNPDVRISVSLIKDIAGGVGPDWPVRAGVTKLGSVADSRQFLNSQLSSYVPGDGNHVTVSASKAN